MKNPPEGGAVLYLRPGCPLCFSLKRSAARAARRHRLALRVVDIRGDADLLERYDGAVPVLYLPGSPPLQGRVPAAEVDAAFRRAADAAVPAGERSQRSASRLAGLIDRLRGGQGDPGR